MASAEALAQGWEEVTDDAGRTYWWNTESNDTTWTKPVAVVAKKGLAAGWHLHTAPHCTVRLPVYDSCISHAGYLSKVGGDRSEKVGATSKPVDELARLRQQGGSSGGVSARLAQFNKPAGQEGSSPKAAADVEGAAKAFDDPAVFFDGSMVGSVAVGRARAPGWKVS